MRNVALGSLGAIASNEMLGNALAQLLRQSCHIGTLEQNQHLVGPLHVTFQVEESRFAAPGRRLQKAACGLLQQLSCALARLDKTGPTRVPLRMTDDISGIAVSAPSIGIAMPVCR